MLYYAGIGSRQTPDNILIDMTKIARFLRQIKSYVLRSGGAIGADQAFEAGAADQKEIFKAHDATQDAIDLAAKYHPAWDLCGVYTRKLHGRNSMIMLGEKLDNPVNCVVAYCPLDSKGAYMGGTGQGLRIAEAHKIKIFNLYDSEVHSHIMKKVNNYLE